MILSKFFSLSGELFNKILINCFKLEVQERISSLDLLEIIEKEILKQENLINLKYLRGNIAKIGGILTLSESEKIQELFKEKENRSRLYLDNSGFLFYFIKENNKENNKNQKICVVIELFSEILELEGELSLINKEKLEGEFIIFHNNSTFSFSIEKREMQIYTEDDSNIEVKFKNNFGIKIRNKDNFSIRFNSLEEMLIEKPLNMENVNKPFNGFWCVNNKEILFVNYEKINDDNEEFKKIEKKFKEENEKIEIENILFEGEKEKKIKEKNEKDKIVKEEKAFKKNEKDRKINEEKEKKEKEKKHIEIYQNEEKSSLRNNCRNLNCFNEKDNKNKKNTKCCLIF